VDFSEWVSSELLFFTQKRWEPMDSIVVRKRVENGGVFIPLPDEWNDRGVEMEVSVRDVTEARSVALQEAARQFSPA
jgi:hypothetical protein